MTKAAPAGSGRHDRTDQSPRTRQLQKLQKRKKMTYKRQCRHNWHARRHRDSGGARHCGRLPGPQHFTRFGRHHDDVSYDDDDAVPGSTARRR